MCDHCGWADLIGTIEDYDDEFGRETLEGILEWVEKHHHCTDRQRSAVENIINARRPYDREY